MRSTRRVTLRAASSKRSDGVAESDVLIDGVATGTTVTGVVLEAAVDCDGGWLLFVSDDVPFEEALSIYRLDAASRVVDRAVIGGMYSTGKFRDLRLEPPGAVSFAFTDDARWRVRLFDRARPALPWWPDTRLVWRGATFTRHFAVDRVSGSS